MAEIKQVIDVKYEKQEALDSLKRQYSFLSDQIPTLEEKHEDARKLLYKKLGELDPLLAQVDGLKQEVATLQQDKTAIEKSTEEKIAVRIATIDSLNTKIEARNETLSKEEKDTESLKLGLSKDRYALVEEKRQHKNVLVEFQKTEAASKAELDSKKHDVSAKGADLDQREENIEKSEANLKDEQERFMWQKNDTDKKENELNQLICQWSTKEKDLIRLIDAEKLKLLTYKGNMKKKEDRLNDLQIKLSKDEKWIRDKENNLKAVKGKLMEQQAKLKEHIESKKIGFDWRELEL